MMYRIILKTTDSRKHSFYNVTNIDCDGKILSISYLTNGKEWTRNYNFASVVYYNVTEEDEHEST